MIGLTQSLAAELAPKRQRVVAVAPALVFTPMMQRHLAAGGAAMESSLDQSHPLGVGAGRDVAAAVAFLASPEARWITERPCHWVGCPTSRSRSVSNRIPSRRRFGPPPKTAPLNRW